LILRFAGALAEDFFAQRLVERSFIKPGLRVYPVSSAIDPREQSFSGISPSRSHSK